uniref:Uncharacterized protein n=1 Tax=Arundo donax TaxID=35708 RepID=A0A0A8ZF79_ARUDO
MLTISLSPEYGFNPSPGLDVCNYFPFPGYGELYNVNTGFD